MGSVTDDKSFVRQIHSFDADLGKQFTALRAAGGVEMRNGFGRGFEIGQESAVAAG